MTHGYLNDTFQQIYAYVIQPLTNMNMWNNTTGLHIDPPQIKAMPGRPKGCKRRDKDEPRPKCGVLSRKVEKYIARNLVVKAKVKDAKLRYIIS